MSGQPNQIEVTDQAFKGVSSCWFRQGRPLIITALNHDDLEFILNDLGITYDASKFDATITKKGGSDE